jgi:Rps23 Pro-64 3,4-dihydroxylase Tpa1-like proline 4-hydroxylase
MSFYYKIIDNFLSIETAKSISSEFPQSESDAWFNYNSPLEKKRACNNWYYFGTETYKLISYLNSEEFLNKLKDITGINNLYLDLGLHGGGLHMQGNGDKLNLHLDYSIHPKLNLKRKINLIIYLSEDWNSDWGGNLELWSHNHVLNKPLEKFATIDNLFNRAVIFDTSQNSWHGFPDEIKCPEDKWRKSIAVYYLTDVDEETDDRKRALYHPTKEQEGDIEVLNLIKNRVKL